jgi:carbamoyl-phosphate synthase large subunit
MAIGRSFQESLQKALRGLEVSVYGFDEFEADREEINRELVSPGPERIWYVAQALREGYTLQQIFDLTKIDLWFLVQIEDIVITETWMRSQHLEDLDAITLRNLKRKGFSDRRIGTLVNALEDFSAGSSGETAVRERRHALGVRPVYKRVDTCAGEFSTSTAYMYSTYEEECEAKPTTRKKIMVLGGGPNRIGQGIEFDYCCVHAALAMREDGYETIMVNCNPETVSTDYDTSDRLYF